MITPTFLLLLILLALVVVLVPIAWAWGKLLLWASLSMLAVILVLTHAIHLVH